MFETHESLNEDEELIDMKSIQIDERPSIGIQDMKKYKNGGLTVASQEDNGTLIYIPNGIYYDLFRAIAIGARLIRNEIYDIKDLKEKRVSCKEHAKELQEEDEYMIEQLTKYASMLENIETIINDV